MAAKKTQAKSNVSAEELKSYYRDMFVDLRRFEEKAGQLYGMGLIGGFCHLYIRSGSGCCWPRSCRQRRRQAHHLLP